MGLVHRMLALSVAVWVSVGVCPGEVVAEPGLSVPLFHIVRNKNTNQVHYTLQVTRDCRLVGDAPMRNHWLMLEKGKGVTEAVGFMEQMAYGFEKQWVVDGKVHVRLKALPKRLIVVEVVAEKGRCKARAWTTLAGKRAQLQRIAVFADESSLIPEVVHVDIYGKTEKGKATKERVKPD